MATKYLARTIIEGGRARYSKWERNQSHGEERALARTFITKASAQPGGFDGASVEPRRKVYKGFADKLGAPRRWLRAQIGRPWNKVRSEIFERFDPRNLAGQHIIFDHLLREVVVNETHERRGRHDLFVDRHGILRAPKPERREPRWSYRECVRQADLQWLAGRRVGGEGTSLYWLVEHSACAGCCNGQAAPCCCAIVDGVTRHGAHKHYRQAQRLNEDELERWLSIHEKARGKLSGPREKSA